MGESSAAPTSYARPTPLPKRRPFQYSLAQLLCVVLSIGGILSARWSGWSSLSLPIILAWLWWFAYARKSWWGKAVFCLAIPAVLCLLGFFHVYVNGYQSEVQKALLADWMTVEMRALEDERLRSIRNEGVGYLSVLPSPWWRILLTWAFGLPLILGGIGYLAMRVRAWRNSRACWTFAGAGLGLLVVLVVVAYPWIRAEVRKGRLRAEWQTPTVVFANASNAWFDDFCDSSLTIRLVPQPCTRDTVKVREFPSSDRKWSWIEVELSLTDREELWRMLEESGLFMLNSELPTCCGCVDNSVRKVAVEAGAVHFEVRSIRDAPTDWPLHRLRKRLMAWLREKGHPDAWELQQEWEPMTWEEW
jgi:hypothetical protein